MTSVSELIKLLYDEGFFEDNKNLATVRKELKKKGFNFSNPLIIYSLKKSKFLLREKKGVLYTYIQKEPPKLKIQLKEITRLNEIFSKLIKKRLGEKFNQDIRELNIAFSNDCGNSAAFLLRKILEKAIFFVFAKNNKVDVLKDNSGNLLGLESMIKISKIEKIKGFPILLPKTAGKLLGIKYLGDSAVHDYLSDVEVSDINPQIPYWSMAIKELCDKL